MTAFKLTHAVLFAVVWMMHLGCSSEPLGHVHPLGETGGSAAQLAGAAATEACTPESMQFRVGGAGIGYEVTGESGSSVVRVIDAVPLMPSRQDNDWTIEVLDAQGNPLAGAQITSTCAFMKVHAHTDPVQQVTAGSAPGTFVLQGIKLSMPGSWDVELTIDAPGLASLPAEQYTRCDPRMRAPGREKVTLLACVPRDR